MFIDVWRLHAAIPCACVGINTNVESQKRAIFVKLKIHCMAG